jgi:hypothetical protein
LKMASVVQSPLRDEAEGLSLPGLISRALQASWTKGLLPEPSLHSEDLIAKASGKDVDALGEGVWREGFDLLTEELRDSAGLNPLGRTIAHGQLVKILRQRISAFRLWERNPHILDQKIEAPVIILGHMRSGTTFLHRLLACDPRFSYTRLHETLAPLARSPLASIASATVLQGFLNRCNPQLRAIHPSSALAPEEEFGLHAFSFHGAMFEAQWNVTRFGRFCEQRDLRPIYAEFRRLVQTLRWKRGDQDKVQLLKAPQFMQDLDEVLNAFPGARIVWVRRDVGEVVASTASLVWNQQRVQSDVADRVHIGREWLRKTQVREQRAIAALASHAPALLEIDYEHLKQDWRSTASEIYRFLAYDFSGTLGRRMEKVASSGAHMGHRYQPKDFGLNR